MKHYTVVVVVAYNLRMSMKGDNPGPKREIITCAGRGIFFRIWVTVLIQQVLKTFTYVLCQRRLENMKEMSLLGLSTSWLFNQHFPWRYILEHQPLKIVMRTKTSNLRSVGFLNAYTRFTIFQSEVDTRHIGWINCPIPEDDCKCIQLSLRGPDHSLRIRQVKVLGDSILLPVKRSVTRIQQMNC